MSIPDSCNLIKIDTIPGAIKSFKYVAFFNKSFFVKDFEIVPFSKTKILSASKISSM